MPLDPLLKNHDPLTIATRLRWAREHWEYDHSQPRDLGDLIAIAADTLQYHVVPKLWRTIAVAQAVITILAVITYGFKEP